MSRYPSVPGLLPREEVDSYSQLVSAPGPYLEFGEFLYLEATSADASATLRFSGKFLSTDGEIRAFSEDMTITATGNQTAVTSRIGPCWLMGFAVRVVAGNVPNGAITASVHVARAGASTPVHVMTLASGEVTNTRALGLGAFTGSSSADLGAGWTLETASPVNPAAGQGLTWNVPANKEVRIYVASIYLTTSAVVADRRMYLTLSPDGAQFVYCTPIKFQAASLTYWYQFQAFALSAWSSAIWLATPVPSDLVLGAGGSAYFTAELLDAADTFTSASITYFSRNL